MAEGEGDVRFLAHPPPVLFPVAMYTAFNPLDKSHMSRLVAASILIEKIAILTCNSEKMAYSMYSYHRTSTEVRELKQPVTQRSLQWTETEPLSI